MRLKSALRRGVAAAVIAGIVVSSGIPAYAKTWNIADGDITVKGASDESGNYNNVKQGEKDFEKDEGETVITGESDKNTVTIDTSKGNVDVTFDDLKIDVSGKAEGDVSGKTEVDGSDDSPVRESNAAVTVKGDHDAAIELDGDNELKSGDYNAGLEKNGHESEGTLTIKDDNDTKGALTAEGGFGGAGIGGGANGTGEVIIGGKAQVKATGSAEHYDQYHSYGAGAAIGDGGTTLYSNAGTVQNGENKFTTDKKSIQDDAKVEMTNIGHNGGSNTVTKTYKTDDWVTEGEQPPEKCSHSNTYAAEKVSPNCTEKGSQTYRCSSCGEITRVVELAPDSGVWSHDHQTVTVQPTCTEDGYKVTKCGRCGKELGSHYSIVKALGHQFVETTVDPTCTESGYTVSKCTRCHEEEGERTNLVAPLGHEYKNGVCIRCGAPEPQENGGSSSAAPNYTVTGAETYETSVVDGRYIIAVPSEDAALNAVLGDLRAIKAQGADVVVFRTRSRESSLVIDEMLAMGPDATPFVLAHNGSEARLTINGAVHNELIH